MSKWEFAYIGTDARMRGVGPITLRDEREAADEVMQFLEQDRFEVIGFEPGSIRFRDKTVTGADWEFRRVP